MSRTTIASRKRVLLFSVAVSTVLAAGCSPIVRYHGFTPSAAEVEAIADSGATRAQVVQQFGRPAAEGGQIANAIYYSSSQFVSSGPFAPREVDRQVVVFRFNASNVLVGVARFGLQDGNVVQIDGRETDDGIADVSIIRQLIGSAGRVNAAQLLGRDL